MKKMLKKSKDEITKILLYNTQGVRSRGLPSKSVSLNINIFRRFTWENIQVNHISNVTISHVIMAYIIMAYINIFQSTEHYEQTDENGFIEKREY